jgi:hypothetical protein
MDGRDKTIRRIGLLRASIKAQQEEVNDLLASLGALEVGRSVHGDWILDVSPTKRFDAATAKKNLTPEQYESILKPTPNSALAKALLDEDYDKTQKNHGYTVKVYRPSDEED